MADADLTASRLREILEYEQNTGIFKWKIRAKSTRRPGDVAGYVTKNGYIQIGVAGKLYLAHRLAWLHANGSWPAGVIDHINGDATDNRIANLRDVSHVVNGQNQRKPKAENKSGFLGVIWNKQKTKWQATLKVGPRNKVLGFFGSPEEAHQAYVVAKRRLHEGCTI